MATHTSLEFVRYNVERGFWTESPGDEAYFVAQYDSLEEAQAHGAKLAKEVEAHEYVRIVQVLSLWTP